MNPKDKLQKLAKYINSSFFEPLFVFRIHYNAYDISPKKLENIEGGIQTKYNVSYYGHLRDYNRRQYYKEKEGSVK